MKPLAGKVAVPLPGTISQTAEEVTALGGKGIALRCDHRNDEEVRAVFERVQAEQGRLDLLVNNVWGGYEHFNDGTEFWKEKVFGRLRFLAGIRCLLLGCGRIMSAVCLPFP